MSLKYLYSLSIVFVFMEEIIFMGKHKKALILWFIGVNALGYIGYKIFSSFGASKAYDVIVNELDTGDTVIMTKTDGDVVAVKKVKREEE